MGLTAVLGVALALPLIAPDPATTNIAVFTVMYIGLATAWNIMGGYTGYISLGHAAFFGFGAYTLGLLLGHLGIAGGYTAFLLVPVAGLATAVLAVGIGWFALRTRAATFVIVTIAFMFMLQLLAENLVGLTGGGAGLSFPVPPWGGDYFNTPYYYAMLGLAGLGLGISWWIRRSKFGLGLLAIRDDEDKALAVGVPTRAFKLTAFVVSATLVGMIGAVYGYYVTYIYPQFVVDPLIGISMVLMVFLGGLGTLSGPVVGALILEPAQLSLAYNFGATRLYLVLYAAVFLLVILLLPRGIVPSVTDLLTRWRSRTGPSAPAPVKVLTP
ncbi:MAG TPA: branched-chain amino acid ABC transporter permease [Candidatus Dormibacteraeota bacterium]|nr:branched-chain amino acid ABC transporter permease [Candidatus Dormibacteraeota bacterium]